MGYKYLLLDAHVVTALLVCRRKGEGGGEGRITTMVLIITGPNPTREGRGFNGKGKGERLDIRGYNIERKIPRRSKGHFYDSI